MIRYLSRLLVVLVLMVGMLNPAHAQLLTPSANNTVIVAGSHQTIIDAAGNIWSISPSGQVVVGGAVQAATSNVTTLAFVNGVMWQKNTSNNWYSAASISPSCVVTWNSATTTSPVLTAVSGTVTPSRAADFLNMIAVNGCLTGGGAPQCLANGGASMLADLQYLGVTHVRTGFDVTMSGASLTMLTTLLNGGISMVTGPPYPQSVTPSGILVTSPTNQISQAHAWQAINPNAIFITGGINEPGLLFPTVAYGSHGVTASNCTGSGAGGGDGCTWAPVVEYQRDYVTALLADNALKSIPILTVSRGGEEPNNFGAQFNTIQGNNSYLPAGTVLGQIIDNHVYPTDQQQYFYTAPGLNPAYSINTSAVGACQPNDPVAGSAFNIQTHFDNVVTFVGQFSGYANDPLVQAQPRAVTEFGYPSVGVAANGDAVTEDKKGRCILNGLLLGWQSGMKVVSIYGMYSGFTSKSDSYGLMSGNSAPETSGIYLHNFTSVLADPGGTARTFTPAALTYTISGASPTIRSTLFQKSNGHYELVLQDDNTNWNMAAGTPITLTPTGITVTFSATGAVAVYDTTVGTTAINTNGATTTATANVADAPIIIDFLPASSGGPTRSAYNQAGGNNSVWNIPFGAGATWSAATDATTLEICNSCTGVINPVSNYGVTFYQSTSASDPTFSFSTTTNGRTIAPDNGSTLSATMHVPAGAYTPGPYPGDNPLIIEDETSFPNRVYTWGGVTPAIQPPGLQAGQGPFTAAEGAEWDDITSDLFGQDYNSGLSGYDLLPGVITGCDVTPSCNPFFPRSSTACAMCCRRRIFPQTQWRGQTTCSPPPAGRTGWRIISPAR